MLFRKGFSLITILVGIIAFTFTTCEGEEENLSSVLEDLEAIKAAQQAILGKLEKLEETLITPDEQSFTSKELEELKTSQQEILTRLESILAGMRASKELEELKASQKEILTKLDIIIKEEASVFPQLRRVLQATATAEEDYSKVYTIPIVHSPVKGPDPASIVIVEFSDFQ